MASLHTHYDNLKVARNAPPEIIRAAYKTLSQKYHPDRNPNNAEAARIMAIINTSYDVLSDPIKRREHDQWIKEEETPTQTNNQSNQPSHQSVQATTPRATSQPQPILLALFVYLFDLVKRFVIGAFIVVVLWGALACAIWIIGGAIKFFSVKSIEYTEPKPYQASSKSVRQGYIRPLTAPNGQPWPTSSGYVSGYQILQTNGLSTVTVDNSRNDSDVFVKLVSINGAQAYPVRQFYIQAFSSFPLNGVTAGSYDIRYRDLSNGGLSRSEAFNLEETQTSDGIQYSNITMTLYKVQNGNMQTYGLSEAEF